VKALSLLGLMAGTLQRALTDRQLSDDLLEQCLHNALALLGDELRPITDTSADKPAHPATSPSRQER
jgi:hypothetical protein